MILCLKQPEPADRTNGARVMLNDELIAVAIYAGLAFLVLGFVVRHRRFF